MKKLAVAIVAASLIGGCAQIQEKVVKEFGNDLQRTSQMASDYDKPAVKQCVDFLLTTMQKEEGSKAGLDKLLKEPTDGILSSALKAALVAEYLKAIADSANSAQFEKDFKANCATVAGDILINVMRDARRIGSRGASK